MGAVAFSGVVAVWVGSESPGMLSVGSESPGMLSVGLDGLEPHAVITKHMTRAKTPAYTLQIVTF